MNLCSQLNLWCYHCALLITLGVFLNTLTLPDWLNRSDADPNNDKEKHLVINTRKKYSNPILEVCGLLINVILFLFYVLNPSS